MGSIQKVGKTATTIKTDEDGWTEVTYHSTAVVSFNDRYVILRTGGWQTVTTKARMNQAANQFYLGYQVSQKNFIWYVRTISGNLTPFHGQKIIIDRKTGKLLCNKDDISHGRWGRTLQHIGYIK